MTKSRRGRALDRWQPTNSAEEPNILTGADGQVITESEQLYAERAVSRLYEPL